MAAVAVAVRNKRRRHQQKELDAISRAGSDHESTNGDPSTNYFDPQLKFRPLKVL